MIVTKIRATISVVVAEKSAQCDALKFPELKKALGQLTNEVSMINGNFQIRITRTDKKCQITYFISKTELDMAVDQDGFIKAAIEHMLSELFGREVV